MLEGSWRLPANQPPGPRLLAGSSPFVAIRVAAWAAAVTTTSCSDGTATWGGMPQAASLVPWLAASGGLPCTSKLRPRQASLVWPGSLHWLQRVCSQRQQVHQQTPA